MAGGQAVTSVIIVTSLYGFHGTVQMSVVGAPSNTTATLSSGTLDVPTGGSASTTLTISLDQGLVPPPSGQYVFSVSGLSGPVHSTNVYVNMIFLNDLWTNKAHFESENYFTDIGSQFDTGANGQYGGELAPIAINSTTIYMYYRSFELNKQGNKTYCEPDNTVIDPNFSAGIGLSISTDGGASFHHYNGGLPVVEHGLSVTDWDYCQVIAPSVVKVGSTFYMVFEGNNIQLGLGNYGSIGMAASNDGITWTKNRNYILTSEGSGWESVNIGTPSVSYFSGKFYVFYHGDQCPLTCAVERKNTVGWASGTSLTNLSKNSGNPVLNVGRGIYSWENHVVSRATVFREGIYYYMFFEGSGSQTAGCHDGNWGWGVARSGDLQTWDRFWGNPIRQMYQGGCGQDLPYVFPYNGNLYVYQVELGLRNKLVLGADPYLHIWQAEDGSEFIHDTGRLDTGTGGAGWSANTTIDSAGYLTFGPGVADLSRGNYTVTWRLMIDDASCPTWPICDNIATIEVTNTTNYLTSADLHRDGFNGNFVYQYPMLQFKATRDAFYYFNVYWRDKAYLKQDYVWARLLPGLEPFDFSISSSEGLSIPVGMTGSTTVTIANITGPSETVDLSCQSGLPPGAICAFTPSSGTPPFSSVLTIATLASAPTGPFVITVEGNSSLSGRTRTTQFVLQVTTRTTKTEAHCSNPVAVNSTTTCTATVTDPSVNPPTGTVTFTDNGAGTFSAQTCTLANPTTNSASCKVTYTPTSGIGTRTITANYQGDSTHDLSSGTFALSVTLRNTTTTVTCPASGTIGVAFSCSAAVNDTSPGTSGAPTGTVTITPGGTCPLVSGSCSVSITPSTAGSLSVSASYAGDSTHAPSPGGTTITIEKRNTMTRVNCVPASMAIAQGSTCAVSVTDVSPGTRSSPTGTVSFTSSGTGSFTPAASCSLVSGSCSVTYTPGGTFARTDTITGNYGGDSTYNTTSGSFALSVTLRTTTTLSCPASGTIGVVFSCSAAVNDTSPGTSGAPTGTVTFTPGGTCPLVSGSCSMNITPSGAGSLSVSASYSGDSTHATSSGSATITVNKRNTAPAVSCSPASPALSQSSTCMVTVTDTSPGTVSTPTGSVSFTSSGTGTFSATSCPLTSGSCSVTYTPGGTGARTDTITGSYGDDNNHYTSSGSASVTVNLRATTAAISCLPATIVVNNVTTCTAKVTDASLGTVVIPTGTITFSSSGMGTFSRGNCALNSGMCSVTYTPIAIGTGMHIITVNYGNDSTHSISSGSQTVIAIRRHSTISISCSPALGIVNQVVTCTATVIDSDAGTPTTPSGSVSFSSSGRGTFAPTTCTLSGIGTSAGCSVNYTPSEAGSQVVTVDYAGNSTYSGGMDSGIISVNPIGILGIPTLVLGSLGALTVVGVTAALVLNRKRNREAQRTGNR